MGDARSRTQPSPNASRTRGERLRGCEDADDVDKPLYECPVCDNVLCVFKTPHREVTATVPPYGEAAGHRAR